MRIWPFHCVAQAIDVLEAERFGEIVIELAGLGRIDVEDRHVELRRLPAQRFLLVVVREGDGHRAGVALLHADQLLLEARDELARAHRHVGMVGGAAFERLAVDLAGKAQAELVAIGNHGALALVLVAAVLPEHALDLAVDFALDDVDHGAVVFDGLEVHQRDRRQHFVADLEREVGLAVEHLIDLGLVFAEVDLGLRRGAFGALLQRLVDAVVDGVLHDFAHG